MFRVRGKRKFGFQTSIRSSLLGSYRMFGSALPPDVDFQVSKTWFSLDGSALFAFFFPVRFQASVISQDSAVLLRFACLESTLLSVSRRVCRDSMLRKVYSHRRFREFARLLRTARKRLIASQSRATTLKSTLLSTLRTACRKSVLHKVESCGRF
jgi:hypothetical protein